MASVITAPDYEALRDINSLAAVIGIPPCVFLAGTIDMGNSRDWQSQVIDELKASTFQYIFNPRRPDWDSSWKQVPENDEFHTQVSWELDHIDLATHVMFNFEATSKSPVTMLELGERLGKFAELQQQLVVVCPKEFYRYGNIAIMCERYGVMVHETLEEGIAALFNN